MTTNHYDHPAFFDKYSQMARSQQGLAGAGEWTALKALLPDFENQHVLDLGCGYGWHCMYAAQQGAKSVIGIDVSKKMLAVAKSKTDASAVTYLHGSMEDCHFADNTFDSVISSLALHYIPSFDKIAKQVHRYLKPDGSFVFSVEHPLFTAEGRQDWLYNADGSIDCFPVDHYFEEGKRDTQFLGESVTKYHKTLTSYLDGLLTNGFQITRVVEPTPPESMMNMPGMKDELRRPMMLIVSAINKK